MDREDCRRRAAELGDPAVLARAIRAERERMVAAPAGRAGAPRPISVWQPTHHDGTLRFVRPEPGPLGDHFAARRVLERKSALLPLRIILFGESVAQGYLYAPHLTPARVLEDQLRAVAGEGQFEVIDLSRINEKIGSLVETLEASVQINPDLFVLFAGNNWDLLETPEVSPYAPSTLDRQAFGDAWAAGGASGVEALAGARLRDRARDAFARVADIAKAIGVPVILVVPEVNLADWETREPPLWLAGGGNAEWFDLLGRARAALGLREPAEVLAITASMKRLDQGLCATSHRLEARAHARAGDDDRAALSAQAEIDAASYTRLCHLGAPRATTAVRALLHELGAAHRFATVDLREVFREHIGTPYGGRRMFLDYCHLTREGMKVAMAAVAATALSASGVAEVSRSSVLARAGEPRVAGEADALAMLGAAIHGAHRLIALDEDRAVLLDWCERSLEASPAIADTMIALGRARLSPCPAVLTEAQRVMAATPWPLGYAHGWAFPHVDAELLVVLAGALRKHHRDPDWERDPARFVGEQELSRAPFLWGPAERFYPEAMDEGASATLRVPWPNVSFALVGVGAFELELTVRLPDVGGEHRRGQVGVTLGNQIVGAVGADTRWSTGRIALGRVTGPVSRIGLRFPPIPPCGDSAKRNIERRLLVGRPADLHPVFGEVFSLRASPASG